ncbi:hypothetical protein B0H14DRAFT_2603724 [Mycena olivaceomarginata]|nr:hypothetical protein B0H14DRAFT_2603724 [Mycena olivaceomarginata]
MHLWPTSRNDDFASQHSTADPRVQGRFPVRTRLWGGSHHAKRNDHQHRPRSLKQLLEDPSMHGMVVVSEVHSCPSASVDSKWVTEGSSGNFKSQVNTRGERTFSPLFHLVSLVVWGGLYGTLRAITQTCIPADSIYLAPWRNALLKRYKARWAFKYKFKQAIRVAHRHRFTVVTVARGRKR